MSITYKRISFAIGTLVTHVGSEEFKRTMTAFVINFVFCHIQDLFIWIFKIWQRTDLVNGFTFTSNAILNLKNFIKTDEIISFHV